MEIKEIEIDKIIPYINNPRKNLNIDKVASSIKEFGFQQPIVIDKDFTIIVGHRFRGIFEGSAIGGMKGRDYSMFIDSASKDKVSYTALGYISQLRDIHVVLGNKGFSIACYICGEDYSLKQIRLLLNIAERYMGSRIKRSAWTILLYTSAIIKKILLIYAYGYDKG